MKNQDMSRTVERISASVRNISFIVFVISCASGIAFGRGLSQKTPLENAGFEPVFREDFTGGSLDVMSCEPAYGSREQFNSYIQPGAIFLGQRNATENTEQQINYYPESGGPAVWTIEFDVRPTVLRESRVLVRPSRFRDGVHVRIGQPGRKTQVVFRNEPGGYRIIDYETPTGPDLGWTHVIVSYRVDGKKQECEFVVAVNGEVRGRIGISQDPRPDNTERPFSIEYNGEGTENGYYIANVRGYTEFLKAEEMERVLDGRVAAYISRLEDPTRVKGPWSQLVLTDQSLINVIAKPNNLDERVLTAVPKSVVKVMKGPVVGQDQWITNETDVAKRNLIIKFGGGYRVVKIVYDSPGGRSGKRFLSVEFQTGCRLWRLGRSETMESHRYPGRIDGRPYIDFLS